MIMRNQIFRKWAVTFVALFAMVSQPAYCDRIKDFTTVAGQRPNQLVGYGLVMGLDGSTSKDGSSAGVSTNTDRERFLKRRREFDCIIIGGNTARSERYAITPCPLVVISRHKSNVLISNPNAFWWNMEPVEALEKAKREFGPDILVEAGPSLLLEYLKAGVIDQLEISITPVTGGEHLIDLNEALRGFEITEDRKVDETRFVTAKKH